MNPASNQPVPCGRSLIGRPNFFFDPPNEGGGGGMPSQGEPQGQQQQQQAPPIEDPFKGMDLDLLDDKTRGIVEKAQKDFAIIANQAKQSQTFQSERDRLQNQLTEVQKQQQQQQQQPSGQQQKSNEPLTFEKEVETYYQDQGIDAKTAAQLAKMNAPLFDKVAARAVAQVHQQFQPVVVNTLERNAIDAFESAQQKDRLGAFQIPEIAERVWQRIDAMSKQGQLVDDALTGNLARIFYTEYLEANGGQPPIQQQQQQQVRLPNMNGSPANQLPSNTNTRLTYPGAGNFVRTPVTRGEMKQEAMNPDERAAMAATVASWPVQPKEFKTATKK